MKKAVTTIICAAALLLSMSICAFANDGTKTMYTVRQTAMYNDSAYTSGVVQAVPQGAEIICYQKNVNNFEHCFYGSSQGWIPAADLSNVRNGNNGGGQDNSLNGTYNATMYTKSSVNLRSGPGLKYNIQWAIDPGFPVFVYSVTDGWAEVNCYGTHGYISTDFIDWDRWKLQNGQEPAPNTPVGPVTPASPTTGTTWANGHDWSAVYNFSDYLAYNPDVAAAFGNDDRAAINHFMNFGMKEGRQASRNWNLQNYKNQHPDLVRVFGDNNVLYYKDACGIPLS